MGVQSLRIYVAFETAVQEDVMVGCTRGDGFPVVEGLQDRRANVTR